MIKPWPAGTRNIAIPCGIDLNVTGVWGRLKLERYWISIVDELFLTGRSINKVIEHTVIKKQVRLMNLYFNDKHRMHDFQLTAEV